MRLDWECKSGKEWGGKIGVKEGQEGRGQKRGSKRTKGAWGKEGSAPGSELSELSIHWRCATFTPRFSFVFSAGNSTPESRLRPWRLLHLLIRRLIFSALLSSCFPALLFGSFFFFRTTKNPDVSTEPLTRPFAHSLAPLTRSLAPDCSLPSLVGK